MDIDGDGAGDACDDDDGDGIADDVDGQFDGAFTDQSTIPSLSFTDQHLGGTSFGAILDFGGLVVTVENEPGPAGLLIEAAGAGGPATVTACGFELSLTYGDSVVATCGSLTTVVISGPVDVSVGDVILVTVPSGATVTISEVSEGQFLIENSTGSAGPIVVVVDGVETVLGPGDADTFEVVGPEVGPRALKEAALARLEPYVDESKRLKKAVRDLQRSLDSELWLDGSHLDPKKGCKVFAHERRAIKGLKKSLRDTEKGKKDALSPEAVLAVMASIDDLVMADRLLALVIIEEVGAAPALDDPKRQRKVDRELSKAEKELARGDEHRDSGDPKKAVQHYRKAWQRAVRAMEHQLRAVEHDDDEHDD